MVEITVALVIRQIVTAVLISLAVGTIYSAMAVAVEIYLRINSKNYKEVE